MDVQVTKDGQINLTFKLYFCAASRSSGIMASTLSPSSSARPGGYHDTDSTPEHQHSRDMQLQRCREDGNDRMTTLFQILSRHEMASNINILLHWPTC